MLNNLIKINNKKSIAIIGILLFLLIILNSNSFAQVEFIASTGSNLQEVTRIAEGIVVTHGNNTKNLDIKFKDNTNSNQLQLYKITCKQKGKHVKYAVRFDYVDNYANQNKYSDILVPLAADDRGKPITQYQFGSTSIYIPVIPGQVYIISFNDKSNKYKTNLVDYENITITVEQKSVGNGVYVAPISSMIASAGVSKVGAYTKPYEKDYKDQIRTVSDIGQRVLYVSDSDEAATQGTMWIEQYEREFLDTTTGSQLEGIITDFLLHLGNIMQLLAEKAFGLENDEAFTIDSLVFNDIKQTTIDLRDLFKNGIQVGPDERVGYFTNSGVISGIRSVYEGLNVIAIIIYFITLLYVGLKILLGVGTANQSKSFKYIQYWITGVFLLFLVPMFLSAIPSINNALVEVLEKNRNQMSKYTVKEIMEELSEDYAGEDAMSIELESKLRQKIAAVQGELAGRSTDMTADEAEQSAMEILQKLENSRIIKSDDVAFALVRDSLNNDAKRLANLLYDNKDQTFSSIENQYKEILFSMADTLYRNSRTVAGFGGTLLNNALADYDRNAWGLIPYSRAGWTNLSAEQQENQKRVIENQVKKIHEKCLDPNIMDKNYMELNINALWEQLENLEYHLRACGFTNDEARKRIDIWARRLSGSSMLYEGQYRSYYRNLDNAFKELRTAILQEELEKYEGMLDTLMNDPMQLLQIYAKQQQRVIYAIAWLILFFQTFAVFFMYLKRIIVTMILICIFPLVMAVYVLDKMGDGKSQSLSTWFKEFIANTTVQFIHAIIYVLIINIAIDICKENPTKNWFILLIACLALFPAEKILRDILGLRSSTLGQLKTSLASIIGIGIMATKLGAGAGRRVVDEGKHLNTQRQNLMDNYKKNKTSGALTGDTSKKSAFSKALQQTYSSNPHTIANKSKARWQAINDDSEKKKKKNQAYRDARKRNREALLERKNAINSLGGPQSLRDRVTIARANVASVTGKASDITAKVRESGVAQGALKAGKVARFAGQELKHAGRIYGKAVGVAAGTAVATDSLSSGNSSAAILAGYNIGKSIGGGSAKQNTKKKTQQASNVRRRDAVPVSPTYGAISSNEANEQSVSGGSATGQIHTSNQAQEFVQENSNEPLSVTGVNPTEVTAEATSPLLNAFEGGVAEDVAATGAVVGASALADLLDGGSSTDVHTNEQEEVVEKDSTPAEVRNDVEAEISDDEIKVKNKTELKGAVDGKDIEANATVEVGENGASVHNSIEDKSENGKNLELTTHVDDDKK